MPLEDLPLITGQIPREGDYTADMQNMKSQTYLEDTTFTAHFSEDKIGETDPQNPWNPG